jgi:hypothetical protein
MVIFLSPFILLMMINSTSYWDLKLKYNFIVDLVVITISERLLMMYLNVIMINLLYLIISSKIIIL